ARARKPQDKALVENRVGLNYTQVYARIRKQQFFSLQDLNEAMWKQNNLFNQTRMQQKPYSREEKFLAEEKSMLKPLVDQEFQIKYYKTYKVAKNNHIYLGQDKHYYSVPHIYIGQQVKVIYTRNLVKIYHQGSLVATHPRSYKKGSYTSQKEHLCSHHRYYKERSPNYYLQRAYRHSEALYQYIKALFAQDTYPEQLYRVCEGILSLSRKIPKETFIRACNLALEHRQFSYGFLKRVLENNMM